MYNGHATVRPRMPQLVVTGLSCVIVAVLYSGYGYFALTQPDSPFKAVYFLYAALATAVACLFVPGSSPIANRPPIGFFAVLAIFAFVCIIQLPFLSANAHVYQSFEQRMVWILMTAAFILLLSNVKDISPVIATLGVVVIVMCALNIAEAMTPWALPELYTRVSGRSAGFHEDPNISATFIACAIPLVCARIPLAAKFAVYVITLFGVLFTVSRGGLLLWFLAVTLSAFTNVRRPPRATLTLIVSVVVLSMIGLVILFAYQPILAALVEILRPISGDVAARLAGGTDQSSLERLYVLRLGWDTFLSSAIFGHGVGYTLRWGYAVGVHNMTLMMLVEYGLVGGAILVAFVRELFRFAWPYGLWIGALFLVGGLFLHTYFDIANVGLMFALYWVAGARLYGRGDPVPPRHVSIGSVGTNDHRPALRSGPIDVSPTI